MPAVAPKDRTPCPDGAQPRAGKPDTRARLLAAAQALARRDGPGHLSLDAVAAEAGVSKGGLLYHFPTKAHLLEALVADHLHQTEAALEAAHRRPDGMPNAMPNAMIEAYLARYLHDCTAGPAPSPAHLAALADHPQLLAPVGARERAFLDRIRADASDPDFATLAFLAVHALRAMRLLGTRVLDDAEEAALVGALRARLSEPSRVAEPARVADPAKRADPEKRADPAK